MLIQFFYNPYREFLLPKNIYSVIRYQRDRNDVTKWSFAWLTYKICHVDIESLYLFTVIEQICYIMVHCGYQVKQRGCSDKFKCGKYEVLIAKRSRHSPCMRKIVGSIPTQCFVFFSLEFFCSLQAILLVFLHSTVRNLVEGII